ncbi:spore germination protein [Shimazuella sp. AN120528]|uniref:GerAB/ArcD/ProY family transporter n=1 Tax=Shimazuella soli TaxID=1892854 RepID=UPI001F109A5F|nr:endospore germination permease [Shimazuella soli]MCH5585502.1 spore germination protein [Shimazuella soli]
MMGKEKIEHRQFAILVLLFTIGTSIIITPSMLAAYVKQDGWISGLLGLLIALLIVWVFGAMGKYFRDQSLVQVINFSFGKYLGFVIGLLFASFGLVLSSLVLSNIGNFVNSRLLIGTPLNAVEYIFIVVIVIGVRLGIETIARSSESLISIFSILFFLLVIAVLPQISIDNIRPIFEHGFYDVLQASYGFISFPFGELVLFLMLTPFIVKRQKIISGYVIGAFIGGVVLILITILSILSLGGEGTAINTYPAFTIAKKIDVGGVIQRIEVIMAGIWMFSIFVKLSICVYTTALCIKQLFRFHDLNCLFIPIAISLIPLSQWFSPSAADYQTYTEKWMMYFTYSIMIIPILTMGVFFVRKKWSEKSNKT